MAHWLITTLKSQFIWVTFTEWQASVCLTEYVLICTDILIFIACMKTANAADSNQCCRLLQYPTVSLACSATVFNIFVPYWLTAMRSSPAHVYWGVSQSSAELYSAVLPGSQNTDRALLHRSIIAHWSTEALQHSLLHAVKDGVGPPSQH